MLLINDKKDLNNKKIRVLHNNSFNEDPSRILRALKFAARFNFQRDKHTKSLQEKYINTQMHDDISWTRIKSELKQCFSLNSAKVYDMFVANENYKLIYGQKPEIKGLEIKTLIDKYNPYHVWLVYLGTILSNKKIIEHFCFTRSEKKIFTDIEYLVNNHLSMMNSNYDVYKFFEKKSTESILVYYLLTQRKEALKYLENLSLIRVELKGDEIKALGIENGREIGRILKEILKKKLNGSIINKNDEIEFVRNKIK